MIALIASLRWHNLQLVTLMILLFPLLSVAAALASRASQHPKQAASQRKTCFPNSQQATPDNIITLMRQTGQSNPSKAAIGVPTTCQCQHGFPQAFAMDPLFANRINSGLLKLTCPILVRAIDELEDSGIMETLNEEILQQKSTGNRMLEEMNERHAVHAEVRRDLLSQEELDHIPSKLGERGTKSFLEAGVAGASPAVPKKDVKCLHAWLADALFMDNKNTGIMGDRITHELAAASLLPSSSEGESSKKISANLSGTSDCHVFCNPTASEGLADPPKPRNKLRLRTGKEIGRRKRRKQEQQQKKNDDNKGAK